MKCPCPHHDCKNEAMEMQGLCYNCYLGCED